MRQLSNIEGKGKQLLISYGSRTSNMMVSEEVTDWDLVHRRVAFWSYHYELETGCRMISYDDSSSFDLVLACQFIREVVMQLHSMSC